MIYTITYIPFSLLIIVEEDILNQVDEHLAMAAGCFACSSGVILNGMRLLDPALRKYVG